MINKITQIIELSSRPVVLVGGGIRLSRAEKELLKFINKTEIPVATSLMGLDAFPHDHESFVGMIGTYGNRYANLTISNADLLIALGTRLDTRQTGTLPESFARNSKIVHVDIDPSELNNKIKADFPVNLDVKRFLMDLNKKIQEYDKRKIKAWKSTVNAFKKKYTSYKIPSGNSIQPNYLMFKLSQFLPEDAIICVDVGQN